MSKLGIMRLVTKGKWSKVNGQSHRQVSVNGMAFTELRDHLGYYHMIPDRSIRDAVITAGMDNGEGESGPVSDSWRAMHWAIQVAAELQTRTTER